MIASTSTCGRRTSSWRITSPRVRWISGAAEMTIALAPSKRVTTAVRPPGVVPPPDEAEPLLPGACEGVVGRVTPPAPFWLLPLLELLLLLRLLSRDEGPVALL